MREMNLRRQNVLLFWELQVAHKPETRTNISASILILARVKQAMESFESAWELINRAQELAHQNHAFWFLNLMPAIEAQFYLSQDKLPNALQRLSEAQAKADEWHDFVGGYELVFAYEIGQIAPVQVTIAQGRANHDSALLIQTIKQLQEKAKDEEFTGLLLYQTKLLILQAIAYDGLGDSDQSLSCFDNALALAEPEGCIRIFMDESEVVRLLLREYQIKVKKQISESVDNELLRILIYTDNLLASFSGSSLGEKLRVQTMPEPLSERELEILRLISTGRSNQEIAELLVITLSTVKTHVNRLYNKMGVKRRTEAILRARELGLIRD